VPRSGTIRKANSTKKSPEKTPRYKTHHVVVVVFVKCIFSVHLYIVFTRFSSVQFPGLDPRALVVIIIFIVIVIIERF